MIKLMIAEDEKLARESIKKLLEKYFENEIKIVAECDNGEEVVDKALSIRPDIILLDIHMPKKDGLEAAEMIRHYISDCEIVIITANNQFEYAKKAITLRVNDFLVKPYSVRTFKEALSKVIEKVNRKKVENSEKNELEKSLSNIKILLEKEFMLDMINEVELKEFDLNTYIKILRLENKFFKCVILKIDSSDEVNTISDELRREIKNPNIKILLGSYLDRLVYYIFAKEEKVLEDENKRLKKFLKTKTKKNIFSVTKIYNDVKYLNAAFQSAKKDLNSKVQNDDIYGYDIPYELENQLFKLILENENKKSENKIEEILKYLFKKNKDVNIAFIEKYIKQLILMIDRMVQQVVYEEKTIVNVNEVFPLIESSLDIEQYRNILVDYVKESITLIKKFKNNKHVKVIEYAKQYIENNFDKNISLDDVSQHIGLSSNYLSKYFKKVVGVNFKDYATNIRIEKAKMMLESSEGNIAEVSEKLGYTDASYFSYAFKKKTGISPKEYFLSKRR